MAFGGQPFTLIDRFDQQTVDTTKWTAFNPSQVSENGVLNVSNVISGTTYGGVTSVNTYDMTGSSFCSQLINAGNQSLASWQAQPVFMSVDSLNCINWYVNGGTLHAQKEVAGSFSDVLSGLTYDSTQHRWFRLRHSGTTLFWDYSADGRAWTNYTSLANPFGSITGVTLVVQAGTFNPEVSQTTMQVANFNYRSTPFNNSGLRPAIFKPGLAR